MTAESTRLKLRPAEVAAMYLFAERYAASRLSAVDFYARLPRPEKDHANELADKVVAAYLAL